MAIPARLRRAPTAPTRAPRSAGDRIDPDPDPLPPAGAPTALDDQGRSTTPAVRLVGVTRRFGSTTAVDDVTLSIGPGEAVGLLGPNGAGKTTIISLVTGLRRADAGTVALFGLPPDYPEARLRLGATPQATGVPATLRVGEALDLVAAHFPDPVDPADAAAAFGLQDHLARQCGGLSGGQQRRLLMALALTGRPELLVLDEPTTGLDVTGRDNLWRQLQSFLRDGGTMLVTSHQLADIEALAERVVVLDQGRLVADDSLTAITRLVDVRRITMASSASDAALGLLPGVVSLHRGRDAVTVSTRDADAAVRALVSRGLDFRDLTVEGASLEDAFLTLTGSPPSPSSADHADPTRSRRS
ncbi:MAG: ABC transporter ATP-binding protein [Acidimicrobiales bacterium]